MIRLVLILTLILCGTVAALAQTAATTPAVPAIVNPPPPTVMNPTPSTASNLMQYVILGSALLGAFMKRWTDESQQTTSKGTVFYIAVTGGVTYLAMDSGMLPDTWITAATENPLKAGVVSFLLASIAGAGLVTAMQVAVDKITAAIKT